MRRRWLMLLVVLLLASAPQHALDDAFPTLHHWQQTTLPAADRYDLAQRFLGVGAFVPPERTRPDWEAGVVQPFTISSTDSGVLEVVEAQLSAVGEHVLVWVQRGLEVEAAPIVRLAQDFDALVAEAVEELWARPAQIGLDGDPRVYVLLTDRLRQGLGGYFSARNTFPRAIQPGSNEHEMIVLSSGIVQPGVDALFPLSILAHEYQHLLRFQIDPNELSWLNEGFSMFTQSTLGFGHTEWALDAFLRNPHVQFNTWGIGDNRAAEYGGALLFVQYFYERYGLDALRQLSDDPADGLRAVERTLQARNAGGAEAFFADWVLANLLRDDPLYGYQWLSPLPEMPPTSVLPLYELPYARDIERFQYSSDYFLLDDPPPQVSIDVSLPESVGLLPMGAASGEWMWYAVRGDNSNPRLTRAFDLREVTEATLRYHIWYSLEEGWDYGYVSVSTDGGATWDIQPTRYTTDENPQGRAYGLGYNGESLFWREETLSLDAYAGQELLVRFEMVTDDAVNFTGMALDDVTLEAVGYTSDFEQDGGGWQAEGWIRSDNRLPQRLWLQAVQQQGAQNTVTRWPIAGEQTITLDIAPGTQRLYIAASPFAPLTLQAADVGITIRTP